MVPAPVDRCRDRTEGFGGRDFGPSDSERDGDAPPLMNVAAGAAALAAARGDKRARPHRRLPLAQRTNLESRGRGLGDACLPWRSGSPPSRWRDAWCSSNATAWSFATETLAHPPRA